ncbi:MAG: PaaI family thioesterase [Thermodesulfobacteriota bacterium]
MSNEIHFKKLENMYKAAPINQIYKPEINVKSGKSEISMDVAEKFFHSAGALHGSVYFKMLDDAAFFAANSFEDKYFVLTASFTTSLKRPVFKGKITAKGKVVKKDKSGFTTESVLYDEFNKEAGFGKGIFVTGKHLLEDSLGYKT